MGTPMLLVQEPCPDLIRDVTSEMPISLDGDMNVEISDMISSDPAQAKDVVQSIKKLIGIRNEKIQLLALSLLETIVKDYGDIVHKHVAEEGVIDEMVQIVKKKPGSLVEKKIMVLICTWQEAFGDQYPHYYAACQELPSYPPKIPTLSATLVLKSLLCYVSAFLTARFLLLYQIVKRLPKKLSFSALFIYSALIGITFIIVPYIPRWFEAIREAVHGFETFDMLLCMLPIRLCETQLGLVAINSELLVAHDGSIDRDISHFMSWSFWITGAVLILQSSEDAYLAGGALLCVLAVSPLLRMITRFIFTQSLRRILMAKMIIMRDEIKDVIGPSTWRFVIFYVYYQRAKEELERSYVKMETKEDMIRNTKEGGGH